MGTIDFNLLPLFVAVAETSSFSRAAVKLNVRKSSVSRGIAALEGAMNVRLFHRTTRQVSLTTAGTALLERASAPLASLQRSVLDLPEVQESVSGQLRITAPIDLGSTVLAPIVARFSSLHPGLEIDLRLTNAFVDLVAEGIDIAFRIASRPLKDSSLTAQKIGAVHLQLFASPGYLARKGRPRSPDDLAKHSWVTFRHAERLKLVGPNGTATVGCRGPIRCDDMFFMREILRQGAGIGLLPTFVAGSDVTAGELVHALPQWTVPQGQLWFLYPSARHLPRKVIAFREFVVECLRGRVGRKDP
ncbi:LysR substrate-binding domain-containing protein [Pendulispora brunnea]|uniref:LysR substrate-binding domain-containing protein n=1 Tax=Pendulispora brunnea TaxID=2905690 RepID=A0ABZ2KNE5_9BACT